MMSGNEQKKLDWKENIADYRRRQEQYKSEFYKLLEKSGEHINITERIVKKEGIPRIVGTINITAGICIIILGLFMLFLTVFGTMISAAFNSGTGSVPSYIILIELIGVTVISPLAIVGGIETLRYNSFRWAITSSICAIPVGLGIISLIITLIHKDEFY